MAKKKSEIPVVSQKKYFTSSQRKDFQEFLRSLGNLDKKISESDYCELEKIYTNGTFKEIDKCHHYYSDIDAVFSQFKEQELLDLIATNLEFIKTNYKPQKLDIRYDIEKVYDHTQLNINQHRITARLDIKSEKALDELSKKSSEYEDKLNEKTKVIEDKLEKSKFDYITILGIFASIVVAFVGSFAFSTSVLQNMKEVSIYRLSFVTCAIGFVFVNMIWLLTNFITNLTGKMKDIKFHIPCIVFNVIFFLIISVSSGFYIYDTYFANNDKEIIKNKSTNCYQQLQKEQTPKESVLKQAP